MPVNIEIKARLAVMGLKKAEEIAKAICGELHEHLHQTDTFFKVNSGRMKLRVETGRPSNLISYHREDVSGPKQSTYTICPVSHPELMLEALSSALGVLGVVEKERKVYLAKKDGLVSRIHLDEVQGLGVFLEFEVIIEGDAQISSGQTFADELMAKFGLKEEDLMSGAYLDHL